MYNVKTFNDPVALQDHLNGVVLGIPLLAKVYGLHGLTFIAEVAGVSVTVTFADASGVGLSPKEILDTILEEAALVGVVALRSYGYTNSANPQLAVFGNGNKVLSTGTANAKLGFSATADTVVTEVATSDIVTLSINPAGPLYILTTYYLKGQSVVADMGIDLSTDRRSPWILRPEGATQACIEYSWTGTGNPSGLFSVETSNTCVEGEAGFTALTATVNPDGSGAAGSGQLDLFNTSAAGIAIVFDRTAGGTGSEITVTVKWS